MIVECYSADVYCDHEKHDYIYYDPVSVFSGQNKRTCDRYRRQDGWIKIEGKDICPDCKTKHYGKKQSQ